MTIWAAWGDQWSLFDKVSFDGINKIAYVHPEVTAFDIRSDLYTSWVDWIYMHDNIKFLPLMRTTGFDPIGSGMYTGDVYFLINGWKLSIDTQKVKVTGVLYSDDYDTPYYTTDLIPQYPVTVSALVTTMSTGSSGGTGPTASQIRQEIDNNSSKLISIQSSVSTLPTTTQTVVDNSAILAQIKLLLDSMDVPTATENADAVWSKPISGMTDKTTIGGYISKVLLSVPKFLGLK